MNKNYKQNGKENHRHYHPSTKTKDSGPSGLDAGLRRLRALKHRFCWWRCRAQAAVIPYRVFAFLCSWFFFGMFYIHILLSRGSHRGTYLMLPSLFSAAAVALVRGARMLPGTQPSAAGEWSLAGWYTRHMFCWLTARTWTTSPWLTQISFSFSA